MSASPKRPWSLLGSNLWLRPLAAEDVPRFRAFLRRRDLLRAGDLEASLRPVSAKNRHPGNLTLVAVDPLGVPAGVFHLQELRADLVLSFAVPREEPRILRESLRLLTAGLPARSRARHLRIGGLSEEALAILPREGIEAGDTWVVPLSAPGQAEEAPASHAR
jgi:hypothetical protein